LHRPDDVDPFAKDGEVEVLNRISLLTAKIAFSIPEELDERLRAYVEREFKGVKGALSITAIKAIDKYLDEMGAQFFFVCVILSVDRGRLPVFTAEHALKAGRALQRFLEPLLGLKYMHDLLSWSRTFIHLTQ